jgi:hypothetical protein
MAEPEGLNHMRTGAVDFKQAMEGRFVDIISTTPILDIFPFPPTAIHQSINIT